MGLRSYFQQAVQSTVYFGSNVNRTLSEPKLSATGGTVVDSGGYRTHIFTSPGSFVVSNAGLADYLVVGSGGAGNNADGGNGGGGGGGGTVTYVSGHSVTSTSYPITVGTGNPATSNASTRSASSSAFVTTALGGFSSAGTVGSPGGASGNANSGGNGSGIPGCGGGRAGGGGGGAGSAGSNATPASPWNAGAGGSGLAIPQFPGPVFSPIMPAPWVSAVGPTGLFGGGGGGSDERNPGPAALGGPGGGGRGGDYDESGTPGVTNTGSGGGGYGGAGCVISRAGGDGAPGTVIIRYLL